MGSVVSWVFDFEIGESVCHKQADKQIKYGKVQRFVVLERLVQECHGGVQAHYRVRAVEENGAITAPFELCSFEVMAYPEKEDEKDTTA